MNKPIVTKSSGGGMSAIAVIRLSGEGVFEIVNNIIKIDSEIKYRYAHNGIIKTNEIFDEVVVIFYKAPKSYTGEDLCEIFCHGNDNICDGILRECIKKGAKLAQGGEFTMRAFLNGKKDLTQAEAVHELIIAESEAEIKSAFKNLRGELFEIVDSLQKELINQIASLEVSIDFPDEEQEQKQRIILNDFLNIYIKKLSNLAETYNDGKYIKDGIRVVILGEPNVGKSMLLNALLKKDRAIVTSEEGTTRDTLEEMFFIDGQKFIIIDTAGIRKTENMIEKLGIERTMLAIANSDIILAVSEVNKKNNLEFDNDNKPVIYVQNKADLLTSEQIQNHKTNNSILISAKTGYNLDKLKETISKKFKSNYKSFNGHIISNVRHYNALVDAIKNLLNAQVFLNSATIDCILSDLNSAYRSLGQITGVVSNEEILDEIFSNFCVGK